MTGSEAMEPESSTGRIAIIGMAGRFPGAPDVESFWRNLRDGVEGLTSLSEAELIEAGVPTSRLNHPRYVRARGRLQGVELFDAGFFGFHPREAELTDPQHRLLLECAWEALEDAGYDPGRYPGVIGAFAGAATNGYLVHHLAAGHRGELLDELSTLVGNDKDHLTLRLGYKLGLRGPCLTVQTACSTSLVAVQLACQALLSYQCDMALAGGVSVGFPVDTGYLSQEGHILSPDGHCRPFDARAQGTVPADGLGLVVLKRLGDALADGDAIRAVILGAATNNDGSAKVGYTAPGVDGQSQVVAMALALAGVDADTITYVETHGTGTALGDPIEVAALTQAFRRTTQAQGFCALGSVKSSIGHLNTAAGIASLIKTVLALDRRTLPASLHFTAPNPEIDFAGSPFFVNAATRSWERTSSTPRRAGVSAFGFGGTNAHVVLEEPPSRGPSPEPDRPWQLVPISARSMAALEAATTRLRTHLERNPELPLADVAWTLRVGRREFEHRRAFVCRSTTEAVQALGAVDESITGSAQTSPAVVFVFPGEGVWQAGALEPLYRTEAGFREEVDRCARLLAPHLGRDLCEVLFTSGELGEFAQPALFVLEYALGRLWMSWGVRPQSMFGHGVGELVAACLAEVFSLEDALALVAGSRRREAGDSPPGRVSERPHRARMSEPKRPYVSGDSGTWVSPGEARDPEYWARRSCPPSSPAKGLEVVCALEGAVLVEVGPGGLLAQLPARPSEAPRPVVVAGLGTAGLLADAWVLRVLARLWCLGVTVDWDVLCGPGRRRVPLPTYPFERQQYWVPLNRKAVTDPPREEVTAKPAGFEPSPAVRRPRGQLRTPYVAPRTEVERQLAAICQEVLGIGQVGIQDDFFALGADSMAILNILEAAGKALGLQVPPAALFQATNLERMAQAFEPSESTSAAPRPGDPLVAIKPEGSRAPLFFVHPAGGMVFPYFELARHLSPDQPFYGLQAVGLIGKGEPDRRIPDMARRYVEAIRAVRPRGPYHLGGFSFGGLVAFEMARQLRLAGHEVGLVAIVDASAPVKGHRASPLNLVRRMSTGIARSIWPHLHDYLYLLSNSRESRAERGGLRWTGLGELARQLTDAKLVQSLLARSMMANFIPPESRLAMLRQPAIVPMFQIFMINLREFLLYEAEPCQNRVTLFRTEEMASRSADRTLGWSQLARAGVDVHALPGEHLTVIRQPFVKVLATRLQEYLGGGSAG